MASVPEWCTHFTKSDLSILDETAIKFLKNLKLTLVHPHCETGFPVSFVAFPTENNITSNFPDESRLYSFLESSVTMMLRAVSSLRATSNLLLRLLAFAITPFTICYLISLVIRPVSKKSRCGISNVEKFLSLFGLVSSSIIASDSLYVLEYGRSYGMCLFCITTALLSVRSFFQNRKKTIELISSLILDPYFLGGLAVVIWTFSNWTMEINGGDFNILRQLNGIRYGESVGNNITWAEKRGIEINKGIGFDLPTIEPGFYYNKRNEVMNAIARVWPDNKRKYDVSHGATPWLVTGDSRTFFPFLLNNPPKAENVRLWLTSEIDGEANAIEFFFPEDGVYRKDKPIYLLLHGLNGGTDEGYVKDFINRSCKDGSTVAVLIARGLMNTPVSGWNLFNGARVSDLDGAAKALKRAASRNQIVAGVGYSMGAIILSNYVARSGKNCFLDAAVSLSGGLNMREQLTNHRSMRLWQPFLTEEVRKTLTRGGFVDRYKARLTKDEFLEFLRSADCSTIDKFVSVIYNGFEDITHYYSEMSALHSYDRISNVSIPFLVIHALDDPLVSWRTLGDPKKLSSLGAGYISMLITKSGGHVGWPLGINPAEHGWKWMSDRVMDFVLSYDKVNKQYRGNKFMAVLGE